MRSVSYTALRSRTSTISLDGRHDPMTLEFACDADKAKSEPEGPRHRVRRGADGICRSPREGAWPTTILISSGMGLSITVVISLHGAGTLEGHRARSGLGSR